MKKSLPIIIILAIIVLALAAWKFMGKSKTASTQGGTQPTGQQQTAGESFTGKIKDAFMKNIPLKCTYKKDDQNFATAYIQNKKYYAEIMAAGKSGYMILIDNCLWSWSKDQAQGVKMCFEPKEGEDIWTDIQNQDKTADTNVDYNCAPSMINDAVFTPPSNVKFANIDELMNQATRGGTKE